jgi:CRP-like cAMP-binding protein
MALSPVGADESQSQLLMGSLFRAIGPDGVRDLVNNGEIIDLDAEVLVFSQGDAADRLYVVLEGAVVPVSEESNGMKGGIRMGVIESGDFFGEIGLLTDQPRNATIRTLVETRLLAINRRAVWHLLSNHEETLTLLLRTLRTRLIDRLVRTHPMFNLFGRAKQGAFAKQFRLIEVRDGSTVIQQGLKHQGLYVVLAGQLEIVESSGRGDKSLGIAEHGDVLGEFSELFEQAAHASVIARSRCWLLNLTHPRFKSIVNSNPRLNELLVQIAEKRDTERRAAYGVSEDPRGGR